MDRNTRDRMASSKNVHCGTPLNLFTTLDAEFHFGLDPCGRADRLLKRDDDMRTFLGPEDEDGLKAPWKDHLRLHGQHPPAVFMNPPYGRAIGRWLEKARHEHFKNGLTVACLLPARVDTAWFQDLVLWQAELRWIRSRLAFDRVGEKLEPALFPSVIAVYTKARHRELVIDKTGRIFMERKSTIWTHEIAGWKK